MGLRCGDSNNTADFLNDKSLAGLRKKGDSWDLMKHVKDMKVTVGVELWSFDFEDAPPAP